MNSLPFHTGPIFERTTPRMATSGALTMGLKLVPPMPPSDEMVKVAPRHFGRTELAVARLGGKRGEVVGNLHDSLLIGVIDHRHHQSFWR